MRVVIEKGERVIAADGVALGTDVFRPAGSGPWPAVLLRTYLGKGKHRGEALGWARSGFACAVQDVRGRYDSGGVWRPYEHESDDGRDTVEWLLSRPWCDGRVAAVGGSYGAFTAWSAAVAHPGVRAVISAVPAMGPMPLQPEDGGVLPLLARISWWRIHGGARRARAELPDSWTEQAADALLRLPVADMPAHLGVDLPGWAEAIEAIEWTARDLPIPDTLLAELDVAALHVGGWHDPFCSETLRHLELVGRDRKPRPPRALVLGPWWHKLGCHRPARYGERRYGEASRFPLGRFQARWLRRVLDGAPQPDRHLRLFLGGENRWVTSDRWHEQPVERRIFYADGERASLRKPRSSGRASFHYDPRDPRPCRRTPTDERDLDGRSDVVVFTTRPLERPCPIVGAPRLTLWGSSDAPATDWVARLLEVTPDGRRLYLAHGLVEASRALAERGERLELGRVHRLEIRLSPVGITLRAGHRLRLEITGSAFPSYARNLGGEPRLTGRQTRRVRQTVCWGPDRATALELPVHVQLEGAAELPNGVRSAAESAADRTAPPGRAAGLVGGGGAWASR